MIFSVDRKTSFHRVAARFERRYRSLQETRGAPYRLTAKGAWAASTAEAVYSFFEALPLDRYRLFLDAGSGDGIVICIAGLFTRAIGIEVDPDLCRTAQRLAGELDLTGRVGFVCGDFLRLPIRKADCLYVYPDKPFDALADGLEGWRGDLLVYGPHFPLRGFKAVLTLSYEKERLTVYRSSREASSCRAQDGGTS